MFNDIKPHQHKCYFTAVTFLGTYQYCNCGAKRKVIQRKRLPRVEQLTGGSQRNSIILVDTLA